jgi:hypothetical protein
MGVMSPFLYGGRILWDLSIFKKKKIYTVGNTFHETIFSFSCGNAALYIQRIIETLCFDYPFFYSSQLNAILSKSICLAFLFLAFSSAVSGFI